MNLMAADQIDSRAALRQLPSLIKAYLRMGGRVGEGAFIDHNFNTTDVLIMMDTDKISDRQRNLYTKGRNL
jgi:putative hemolysin